MIKWLKSLNKIGITAFAMMVFIVVFYSYSLISYAFFSKKFEQNAKNNVTSASFSYSFTEQTGSINLDNIAPTTKGKAYESKDPYTFTITNTGNTDMYYNITLNTTGNSDLDNYLTYELDDSANNVLKTDIIGNLAKYDKYNNYRYTDDNGNSYDIKDSYIIYNGFLAKATMDNTNTNVITPGETKQFKLYIWMNEDVTDEAAMGKEFNGKIIVIGSSDKLNPICKRATTLHNDGTHTYGNLGTTGTLAAGDAFDCDVNADGNYSERFYYVADQDTDTAVLLYNSNVSAGVANNTATYAFDASNNAYTNGPATAVAQLPTTSQWPNVKLKSTTRDIKDENGTVKKSGFDYSNKAARLLTIQEAASACGVTIGARTAGELGACVYLMENTYYQSSTIPNTGYWLENPCSDNGGRAWLAYAGGARLEHTDANQGTAFGARPAIEVAKTDIQY